ncbi:hypothetical protein Btru_018377 [Bulinus truncatus]|nr:hypothetical protein Btru_018377 [Bulinus truncatus]
MANSKKLETSCRRIIGVHSARAVLLDVTSPLEKQAGMSVIESLENVLCLCGKMEGPSRIPLISIYLLTSSPLYLRNTEAAHFIFVYQQALPFSCTKGNFVHIHTALTEIRTFLQESLTQFHITNEKSCVQQAIVEACSDYRRYIDGLPKPPHNFGQLEIIVLTGHGGQHIQVQFKAAVQQLDLSTIKRVVSVTVRSSLNMYTMTGDEGCPDVSSCEDTTGLIDLMFLDCDPYSLQSFFYQWLNETSNDSEHLHLILPPPSPADAELVIQCDMIEQMLSPCQLPFHDVFVST